MINTSNIDQIWDDSNERFETAHDSSYVDGFLDGFEEGVDRCFKLVFELLPEIKRRDSEFLLGLKQSVRTELGFTKDSNDPNVYRLIKTEEDEKTKRLMPNYTHTKKENGVFEALNIPETDPDKRAEILRTLFSPSEEVLTEWRNLLK